MNEEELENEDELDYEHELRKWLIEFYDSLSGRDYNYALKVIELLQIYFDTDNKYVLGAKCDLLMKLGRFDEANVCLNEILETFPNDAETHFRKAKFYVEIGIFSEAIKWFESGLHFRDYYQILPTNIVRGYEKIGEVLAQIETDKMWEQGGMD